MSFCAAVASDYALWDIDITTEELTAAQMERWVQGCRHSILQQQQQQQQCWGC
jgi:hypothetical protein